jgi:hypothetical protein
MTKDELLKEIATLVIDSFKKQIQIQGHTLTGELEASFEASFLRFGLTDVIAISFNDYGVPLDTGVSAERIPFSLSGNGGKSRYIEGLTRFAKLRFGVSDREAQSIAFAIAQKHKKEGMPTKDSYQFSKNGSRINWIDLALSETAADIDQALSTFVASYIDVLFQKLS